MQWTLKSPTARSFEGKWSPKVKPPYEDPEDLEDDIPLVFRMPSWQLRACLASVLITPVLYRLYLIMVTIGYVLFSNKPCQTFSPPPRPACPVVDLSWTGVFPCELGWRGSALAVLILSAVLITCYSLITACLVRWNTRKQLNIQYCTTPVFETPEKPTKFQVRVQSTNRLMLPPTLSLCILLLIFRLLLQSGDVEANPGPTLGSILILSDLQSVYERVIQAAGNWFNLGLALGLGHGTLKDIKDDYHRNKDCLREMIAARLKTGPLTYSEICSGLRAPTVERNDVAEAIEEQCKESKSGSRSTLQPDETIGIYRSHLTSIYNTRSLPADEKYPLQCTKHFVNLKCADVSKHLSREEIKKSWSKIVQGKLDRFPREKITMDQIASKVEGKFSKLVVIKGAPGGGKTTLSWELCRRWANGEVWTDYSLVVLLRLRDENVQEAVTLVDLFQCEDNDVSKSVHTITQNHHGRGILFVLEGLDELPPSLRQKDSIFMKLITGRRLSSCTVLVTTRPWAVCDLPITCSSRIDQFIEILGFSSEKIQEYIDLMIKDGAPPELREYINSNPHISSAMYNPLHARIVVEFYRENHDKINSVFPNTTTELYTAYSQVLIERYLHDHPDPESDWSGELSELPSSIQEHFDKLCQIAYNGITKEKQQLVFFKEDGVDGNTTLGFMNTVHPLYRSTMKRNSSPSYNFLHLTLQEFLAAIHIWRTFSQQDQLLFIETRSKKYSMIILFLAGLTQFSDPWTKCVMPTPQVDRNESPRVYLNRENILWLYETQNEQLISSFDNFGLRIKLMQPEVDPLYFFALGYCIAVGKFMLELKYSFSNEGSVEIFNQNHLHLLAGLKRHNSKCSSQIEVLDIFPDSLYEIIDYIPAATQGVLKVNDSKDMPMASKLSKFLGNVETVSIPSFPYSLEVWRTLKIIHLTCCVENSSGILNDKIMEFCPSLEYLEVKVMGFSSVIIDLDDNKHLNGSTLQCLVFGLNIKRFKELKRCQLFPSSFGPILTDHFTKQANIFTDHFADFLKHFGLFTGDLPTLGLKHLVSQSLPKCSLLEKLTIDLSSPASTTRQHRKILQNLDNIFKAPRENSSVRELSCKFNVDSRSKSNQIIDEFCALLQQNISLEELCLEVRDSSARLGLTNNPMPSLILKPIVETVCNLTLKKFVVIKVHIIASNDTIVAICNALENNKYLEYLHLPTLYMEPRQRFLLPIANALSKNLSLTTLILQFEPTETSTGLCYEILKEDTKAVGDMLKVNNTLRILHLMVDILDWSPIIEGLKLNTTIRELHIPSSAKKSAIKCIDYVHVRSRIKYPRQYH